jgi:hypothetical protein
MDMSSRPTLKIDIDLTEIKLVIVELFNKKSNDTTGSVSSASATLSASDVSTAKTTATLNSSKNLDYKVQTLSDFNIKQIKLVYLKRENNRWLCKLSLKEIYLTDIRPNSNLAVKQMFVPLNSDLSLIKISYVVDANNNAHLKFGLDNMRINLCLPYILKLYQIAMSAIGDDDTKKKKETAAKQKKPADKHVNLVVPAKSVSNSSLRVTGLIRLPMLILFAEPEKENSKVLVMQTEIKLDFMSEKGSILFRRKWFS